MRNPDDPTASTDSPDEDRGDRSFYGRWSRRKRQARDGVAPADDPVLPGSVPGETAASSVPAAVPEEHEVDDTAAVAEPVLTDADMPPLESLGDDDDYSGFMSPGVSEGLRNQALRKLFMSSQFNMLDGLNDYDDDFRSFEALGDIITSDMRHQMEVEAERAKREAEERARAMLSDDADSVEATEDSEEEPTDEPAIAGEDRESPDSAAASTDDADDVADDVSKGPRDV